jgi:heparan-alpha-glucosaminide N-acetyltransferase
MPAMTRPIAENAPPSQRLLSLDAYRGLVMLAMASAGLRLGEVLKRLPADARYRTLWEAAAAQVEHTTWRGCTFWDLIQPSFMFIVGVALPFSDARRRAQGQPWVERFVHALGRSAILILLALFLGSQGRAQTDFSFVNVLAQIGLGYTFVFLVLDRPPALQLIVTLMILVGYWAYFASSPLPDGRLDPAALGVTSPAETFTGFAAHWNKGTNAAAAFDRWFLNRFPRPSDDPFRFNPGGYATLNFVPSIATMIFGVLAGGWLRSPRTAETKVLGLLLAAAVCLAAGMALDVSVCPVVKRIWTPSWVVFSTGWTCGLLAIFYGVIDVRGHRSWAFPLVVVGANSIAIYVMAQLLKGYTARTLKTHFGPHLFDGTYGPMIESASVLLVFWLVCLWMYRNKIFVKI